MSDPNATGADLARMALQAACRAAKTKPSTGPARPKRSRTQRSDGRDPMRLGSALTHLMDEHGWDTAVTGGNILDQWATLCPQYVGTVQPVAYDPQSGRLDLRPGSHAYATQLRLLDRQLRKQINDKLGRIAVRALRVLPVGTLDTPAAAAEPDPVSTAVKNPDALVRTRETASPGYRQALETALAHKPDRARHLNPIAAAAIERQNQALTEHREPETAFTDAVAEQERLEQQAARQQPADPLKAAVQAALRYKHSGGSTAPVRRLFEAS